MEGIPTELLYAICSLLNIDDILSFRLVNKLYADIGAAYMLPEVTFYMHHQELDRLREISLHPVFSKHVRSLTYFAQTFDSPTISWRQFVRDHKRDLRWNSKLKKLNLSPSQLLAEYHKYVDAVAKQDAIVSENYDIAVLNEVLPRFPRLEAMTMSAGNLFYEGRYRTRRKSPLHEFSCGIACLNTMHPEGKRPLEALLLTNANAKCALTTLRAGSLHWRFFKRSDQELMRMFKPLANLTCIELNISVDPADNRIHEGNSLAKCQRILSKGAVRKILKSMPQLRCLCVEVLNLECDEQEKGAWLRDIVEPGFRWPHLTELVLGGFVAHRSNLMDVLMLHKDTLRRLCLRDVTLESTSWRRLLPDIRKNLYLEDACICGDLYGRPEGDEDDGWAEIFHENIEYWDLSVPEVGNHDMRESINMYCREGGQEYPDELPLSDLVVGKYYEQYVMPFYEDSDDESRIGYSPYEDSIDLDVWRLGEPEGAWEDVSDEEELDEDEEDEEEDGSNGSLNSLVGEEASLAFHLLMAGALIPPFGGDQDDSGSADDGPDYTTFPIPHPAFLGPSAGLSETAPDQFEMDTNTDTDTDTDTDMDRHEEGAEPPQQ